MHANFLAGNLLRSDSVAGRMDLQACPPNSKSPNCHTPVPTTQVPPTPVPPTPIPPNPGGETNINPVSDELTKRHATQAALTAQQAADEAQAGNSSATQILPTSFVPVTGQTADSVVDGITVETQVSGAQAPSVNSTFVIITLIVLAVIVLIVLLKR
ncbi:MAG TPA: hypothetical protein VN653_06150 [Anaerolineales bacterium]|nr:hypothetical protein [Anaerolineales bacterium]